jgi:hypothetical protein
MELEILLLMLIAVFLYFDKTFKNGVAILTAYGIQYLAYMAASSAAIGVGVGITALLLFFCITGE